MAYGSIVNRCGACVASKTCMCVSSSSNIDVVSSPHTGCVVGEAATELGRNATDRRGSSGASAPRGGAVLKQL
jgi:hypothetical protein